MGKNKKGSIQQHKKKQASVHEAGDNKVSQNGTGKKESNPKSVPEHNKNKSSPPSQKQQNQTRATVPKKKSSFGFCLSLLFIGLFVAVTAVVFREEIQTVAENIFQKYIHPEVLVTRHIDSASDESQQPSVNILSESDSDDQQAHSAALDSDDEPADDLLSHDVHDEAEDSFLDEETDDDSTGVGLGDEKLDTRTDTSKTRQTETPESNTETLKEQENIPTSSRTEKVKEKPVGEGIKVTITPGSPTEVPPLTQRDGPIREEAQVKKEPEPTETPKQIIDEAKKPQEDVKVESIEKGHAKPEVKVEPRVKVHAVEDKRPELQDDSHGSGKTEDKSPGKRETDPQERAKPQVVNDQRTQAQEATKEGNQSEDRSHLSKEAVPPRDKSKVQAPKEVELGDESRVQAEDDKKVQENVEKVTRKGKTETKKESEHVDKPRVQTLDDKKAQENVVKVTPKDKTETKKESEPVEKPSGKKPQENVVKVTPKDKTETKKESEPVEKPKVAEDKKPQENVVKVTPKDKTETKKESEPLEKPKVAEDKKTQENVEKVTSKDKTETKKESEPAEKPKVQTVDDKKAQENVEKVTPKDKTETKKESEPLEKPSGKKPQENGKVTPKDKTETKKESEPVEKPKVAEDKKLQENVVKVTPKDKTETKKESEPVEKPKVAEDKKPQENVEKVTSEDKTETKKELEPAEKPKIQTVDYKKAQENVEKVTPEDKTKKESEPVEKPKVAEDKKLQENVKETPKDKTETKKESEPVEKPKVAEDKKPQVQKETEPVETAKEKKPQLDEAEQVSKTQADQDAKNLESERASYPNLAITNEDDFTVRAELDEADELLASEKLEKAIEKYDAILQKQAHSPRGHYGKGITLDKLGFKYMSNDYLEHGINFLAYVLQLPNVPDELFKLAGRKLADRQQFRGWGGQAVTTFKTLIDRFPDDLKLKNEFGVSYMMIGQTNRARDVFKEVLSKDTNDGFAKAHLGFIVKTKDNDLERAVELLKEGVQSGAPGTEDGRFYLHLGDSLLRLGQETEARKFYQQGEDKGLFLSAWQRSLYNVNGLTGRPFWTAEQTGYQEYLEMLVANWQVIRDEGLAQLDAKTGSFMPEDENLRDTGDWKQFTLYQQGRKNTENCEKAPKTCAIIDNIPDAKGCKRGQVKFSVMSPGIHVWPHVGPTNCRIRTHLGLIVPEGPVIRVMNETRTWKEGNLLIFDDSFEHEVWHEGSELRLVLIVDFWHPELTEKQKRGLSAI